MKAIEIFTPALCFWGFSHGFGKPSLQVFQHVATRLRIRGVKAPDVLMVGENEAGDLLPAKKFGWRTWLLTSDGAGADGRADAGDWAALAAMLNLSIPADD